MQVSWTSGHKIFANPAMIKAAQPIVGSGGHSLSLQRLARSGATLVGRPLGVSGDLLTFDDSANANIAAGDTAAARMRGMMDELIRRRGLDAATNGGGRHRHAGHPWIRR